MRKVYRGRDIEVSFDLDVCIHVGECLLSLPGVFDARRRPWIKPDEADADSVANVIERCPSGALRYRRLDGGPEEDVVAHTTITPLRDGPLLVRGLIEVRDEDGSVEALPRATLCRCGLSNNKPFCDNSHIGSGFRARGGRIQVRVSAVRPAADRPIVRAEDPRSD